jgi:hypothetical protein
MHGRCNDLAMSNHDLSSVMKRRSNGGRRRNPISASDFMVCRVCCWYVKTQRQNHWEFGALPPEGIPYGWLGCKIILHSAPRSHEERYIVELARVNRPPPGLSQKDLMRLAAAIKGAVLDQHNLTISECKWDVIMPDSWDEEDVSKLVRHGH